MKNNSHPSPASHTQCASPHAPLVAKWRAVFGSLVINPLLRDFARLEDTYLRDLAALDPCAFSDDDYFTVCCIVSAAASTIERRLDHPAPKITAPLIPACNPNN